MDQPFLGSHGDDWCCRPVMLGPPDKVGNLCTHWLIVPGPPLSCYYIVFPALPNIDRLDFYHAHPTTWSLHVVLDGKGYYYVDGKRHEIEKGSVMYHGPGVPHCGPFPSPGSALHMVVVQHPSAGHAKGEWVVVPEAGLIDAPGDKAAFEAKYGKIADLADYIDAFPDMTYENPSARWKGSASPARKK